jgi:hypothetical protein
MYVYLQDTLMEKWEENQKKYKQSKVRAKLKTLKLISLTYKMVLIHSVLNLWIHLA